MAPSPHVRALMLDEIPVACDVLARSFWDDPVQIYLHPNPRSRYQRTRIEFRMAIQTDWRKGVVYTTDDLSGVAVWCAPNRWRTTRSDVLRQIVPGIRAFGTRLRAGMELMQRIEAAHPDEPHWYLALIGTDPGRTGRGVGGALIEAMLDRCDREGLPAYLESSKIENVAYYRRFGFEQTGEILTEGGPTLWPMWREPHAR
ncbi:MAG: GNAT family N-acetyltransferase [Acidimicrobiales bacterium]|nr:GNAT family N-acetyltransferase [Acidimicrobiales bacterium]MCB1249200.1 GNAT family N-acetyltransferase [Acidimicrobiales bacterium]MCB1262597.1 GNAT family N-acetyltransferase [Acidimicrobiales bacterium]